MRISRYIQSFGSTLSAMIMPNIGAFIAWGLITALFIPTGWFPQENLAMLIDPMLYYLLPLLIGYTAGSNVGGLRGGVMGAIATIGVIAGSDVPMFLGAMLVGPLAGYLIKRFDAYSLSRVRPGFEMLINNFSIGILGMCSAIAGFLVVGPMMLVLTSVLNIGVTLALDQGILPLIALFIEPGKVLFLNNAINHGVLTPLGIEQARDAGKSILFLLETNPGPGLGVLLAYSIFGKDEAKKTAPASSVILFFGGIHEIYFPYILMRPILIVSTVLGSASAVFYYQLTSSGLVSAASPGSIISLLAMSPRGSVFHVVVGVLLSSCVSFLTACFFVRSKAAKTLGDAEKAKDYLKNKVPNPQKVVFACQAGMGSSAMGAASFRKRVARSGLLISHAAVSTLPLDADIVVCQAVFAREVQERVPSAELIIIDTFLSDPALDTLAFRLSNTHPVLKADMIVVGAKDTSKEAAIRRVGELLIKGGYVDEDYLEAMFEREAISSTYIGMGIAVPHGTESARGYVRSSGIAVVQYPEGIDFEGEEVYLLIGIAGTDDTHLDILSTLSTILSEEAILEQVKKTDDPLFIYHKLKEIQH